MDVFEMGIGCNKWGTTASHDQTALATAYVATLDAGVRLFNTAQAYNTSEKCLGRLRRETGRDAFIITKFNSLTARPDALIASLRTSLEDLGLDTVDGLLVHFPCGDIEALASSLAKAVELGLARRVGCSNYGEDALRRLHAALKQRGLALAFNEIEFSLCRRAPETDGLLAACRELGVCVLAWAPMGSGRLAGRHATDVTNPGTRALVETLLSVAKRRGKTTAQVAINWCICKGTVPIPGARTPAQARENCGAVGWRLSTDEVAELDGSALVGCGIYDDPEAVLCFFGIRPPPKYVRALVLALVRWGLRAAAYLLPLQRDRSLQ